MKLYLPFILALCTGATAAELSFNKDIRPLLSDRCYYCHGTDSNHRKAGLRLDTFEGAVKENDGVRALVPGDPSKSELWNRIQSTDEDEVMPPPDAHKPAFTATEKALIERWIKEGGKYEPHWAFVAPKRPAVPKGESAVDHFIGRELMEQGLNFTTPAEPALLLRRLTLDLTGLPPTLAELDAFEQVAAKDLDAAYTAAIERLLKSPRYGERMTLDWLDVARYSDTNGFQMDAVRMNWPWRDWVMQAFQDNMPFDQFTLQQLAGDLLPNATQDQLIATAFNRNHMLNAEGGSIPEENRAKNIFDRVETTGTTWLGLTMNCCQCHDHKFDPLLQKDYYSMSAMFNQLSEPGGVDKRFGQKIYSDNYDILYMIESPFIMLGTKQQNKKLDEVVKITTAAQKKYDAAGSQYKEEFIKWVKEMRENPDLILTRLPDDGDQRIVNLAPLEDFKHGHTKRLIKRFLTVSDKWKHLIQAVNQAKVAEEKVRMQIPHVMVMRDDKPRDTFILQRGNYETPGEKVSAAVPSFLPKLPTEAKADRLAFAKWLVSPEQPLMSRVVVNRLWQMFTGRGLVKTPDDFGLQGALPSHPELLDWLAVEFRESGWNVQHMIKLIVTSRSYRQSGIIQPAALAQDPENIYLSRGPRFRTDSRFLRDQALALSGLLIEKQGGPAVQPYQPPGIWEEMSFGKNRYVQEHGDKLYRRSLYTFWRRSVAPANFFDTPARQVCVVKMQRTSTPLHALTTLNDPTYVEAARVWAEQLLKAKLSEEALLNQAFRAATSRKPTTQELATLLAALKKTRHHYASNSMSADQLLSTGESKRDKSLPVIEHAAVTTLCLMILNLDETLNR